MPDDKKRALAKVVAALVSARTPPGYSNFPSASSVTGPAPQPKQPAGRPSGASAIRPEPHGVVTPAPAVGGTGRSESSEDEDDINKWAEAFGLRSRFGPDSRVPTEEEVAGYKTMIAAAQDIFQQRVVGIGAFRDAVRSLKEAASGLSEVDEKLSGQVKQAMEDSEKVQHVFDRLMVLHRAVIGPELNHGTGKVMTFDAKKVAVTAQEVFGDIDYLARNEVPEIGEERAAVCAEATASLAELLQPRDEILTNLNKKTVSETLSICRSKGNLLKRYGQDPTVEACKNGLGWLVGFLTNAAPAKT